MRFVGQHYISHRTAKTFYGIIHSFALYRKGAGVVVHLAMNEQKRCFYFVGKTEWTHVKIQLRIIPVSAVFILKAKRSEAAVIGAATCDTGFEKIGVCQQVG